MVRSAHNARKSSWAPRFLIRQVRLSRSMSQGELAARIGTVSSRISEIERGNQVPTMSMLNEIARALRCKRLSELVDMESMFGVANPPNRIPARELRLNTEQVQAIRLRRARGESIDQLAEEYGVSPSMISLVASGKRYTCRVDKN